MMVSRQENTFGAEPTLHGFAPKRPFESKRGLLNQKSRLAGAFSGYSALAYSSKG